MSFYLILKRHQAFPEAMIYLYFYLKCFDNIPFEILGLHHRNAVFVVKEIGSVTILPCTKKPQTFCVEVDLGKKRREFHV